ncbi:MAG: 4a-hydroxytetrahydrobiopterin dehydratase [Halorhodospira sp.]
MSLTERACVPCQGGVEPMDRAQAEAMLAEIPAWQLDGSARMIYRRYKLRNFVEAVDFVNRVTEVAEAEDHHPDILLGYGYAEVRVQTHKIGGLHENDFILAAKVDELYQG